MTYPCDFKVLLAAPWLLSPSVVKVMSTANAVAINVPGLIRILCLDEADRIAFFLGTMCGINTEEEQLGNGVKCALSSNVACLRFLYRDRSPA